LALRSNLGRRTARRQRPAGKPALTPAAKTLDVPSPASADFDLLLSRADTVMRSLLIGRMQREGGNAYAQSMIARAGTSTAEATLVDPATVPPDQRRMIRQGSTGDFVRYAQTRLNEHGATPPLAIDGSFGPLTNRAALSFQRTHGLVPDGIIGPRSWASLDGPAQLSRNNGAGLGGAGGPGSSVMLYDTGSQRFSPPAAGTTMSQIQAQIKAKQDLKPNPDLGPTVNVKGVAVKTPEEIFVWNVLLQRANRSSWGSEIDVVTEIGPAPKGGGPAPVGQITIQIDGTGNATAELIAKGAVGVPAKFPDRATAVAALKADFGFSNVVDGTAPWTVGELNKAHEALSRLPAADRSALAGVQLIRDHTLTDDAGNALSGKFESSASVTRGDAQHPSVATRSEALRIADLAFANDDISFVGGKGNAAVGSFTTIVHEAGHAVESKALRDAQFAKFQAQAVVNNDTIDFNAKQQATNAAVTATNTAQHAAMAKFNKYKDPQKKSASAFVSAVSAAVGAINTYANNETVAQFGPLEAAARAATARRDAQKAKLPTGHPADSDFASTITAQDAWLAAAVNRANAFIKLQAARDDLGKKQKAETAVKGKKVRSKHLQDFVDVVNKNKIPPLTAYAKSKWPGEPEEFFAEAYALWLNDPVYLEGTAKPLKDWFDGGGHR
jgi:peptidoglycan hydrolase-like protein with peptidoglycan-binding domain